MEHKSFITFYKFPVTELKEQYDLYQQTSTDLYNQLVDMSDDEFEKLSTANSKFDLTKEEKVKYKHVMQTINKVTDNKNKLNNRKDIE